jgi:hypothetical protein
VVCMRRLEQCIEQAELLGTLGRGAEESVDLDDDATADVVKLALAYCSGNR